MKPMDKAWMLLKRQTTLGEFHPDMPSPHGPVTHYHGTSSQYLPSIRREGLRQSVNEPIYGQGVYAADNYKQSKLYADDGPAGVEARVNFDLSRHQPSVIGIRGQSLPFSSTVAREHFGEGKFNLNNIDPKYLVTGDYSGE